MSPNEEGNRDRRNGATIWQNPFATMTLAFFEWENGWLEQDERLRKGDTVLVNWTETEGSTLQ